jgi:putative DNA primase/helicase
MDNSDFEQVQRVAEKLRARVEPPSAKQGRPEDGIVLKCAADIKPEVMRWLWPGHLARGKLAVLAGSPGQGKTTLALACAATVSGGGRWPDGSGCEPGTVLIWSGEDDPADTLLPRLIAMGADRSRVFFVTGSRIEGEVKPFDPARDLVSLTAAAERIGDVRLLIVDPVVSTVGRDSNNNGDVRRALQPVVDLASMIDAAALGIHHFAKGSVGRDPAERLIGSVAFQAVARVVMVAAKVKPAGPDDVGRRILIRAKSNIGPDDDGFEYHLEQVALEAHPDIVATRVLWGDPVQGSARALLREAEGPQDEGGAQDDDGPGDAAQWLRELLAKGPCPSFEVRKLADDAGYSKRSVQRAMKRAGVQSRRDGYPARTVWFLAARGGAAEPGRATVAPVAPASKAGATVATGGATDPDGAAAVAVPAEGRESFSEFEEF